MTSLAALPFVHALQQHGGNVYMVGGTVRDALLNRPRKDVDLLVTGIPQADLIQLLRRQGRVQLTGRAFGVLKFLPRGWQSEPIDIALPRTEISTGVGHRDFEVSFDHTLPIEVDLGRRDFTMNAIATDLATEHRIDPFGGQQDLEHSLLRQVSDLAFPEDPLRMLRGVQLAARFHLQVEPITLQAMTTHAASITTVAPERIAEELRKLFQADTPSAGFRLMHNTGLLSHILPETQDANADLFSQRLRLLDTVQQHDSLIYRGHLDLLLTALFQGNTTPELARDRLDALKMTMIGADPNRIAMLVRHADFDIESLATAPALRHFAHQVSPQLALMLFDLRLANQLANHPDQSTAAVTSLRQRLQHDIDHDVPFTVKALALNGNDLQQLGIPPGPQMGQLLQHLLQHVLDDPNHNTREALVAVIQQDTSHDA